MLLPRADRAARREADLVEHERTVVLDPLDHGGSHGDDSHGGGHGDDHNGHDDHGGESHSSSYIDRTKRFMDQGYSMSLKVLSGVHA